MQPESHLFLIRFDFSGCFSAWNPGLNLVMHRKEGCWVSFLWHSLCPISPASRTSGIYGHLGPKLQAPTFSKGPQPSEQRLSSKADSVHFAIPQKIPVTRGRKSKRKYGFLFSAERAHQDRGTLSCDSCCLQKSYLPGYWKCVCLGSSELKFPYSYMTAFTAMFPYCFSVPLHLQAA